MRIKYVRDNVGTIQIVIVMSDAEGLGIVGAISAVCMASANYILSIFS